MEHVNRLDDPGLGSPSGIRWLLAVGGLVLSVSVYRLVETQWAGLPVPFQFAALVLGALAVFGTSRVTTRRLRLPMVGAALQVLFGCLVPVLCWGAAYLELVGTTAGAIVYVASTLALLWAFRSCLRVTLRSEQPGFLAAFAALSVSMPLLAGAATRGQEISMVLAGALGAVLFAGSRHINRSLFHRDRKEGVDRPVHLLPFVSLTILYGLSLQVSGFAGSLIALPLAIVGASFVATGEEYYRALARSLGAPPEIWPRRSVALLAWGFALVAVSAPLSFLDTSGRVPAIVFLLGGALLVHWSRTYDRPLARSLALVSFVFGYHFLAAWLPALPRQAVLESLGRLGLETVGAKIAFAQLGLSVLFAGTQPRGSSSVARAHRLTAVLHLGAAVMLSALSDATTTAPLALTLALSVYWKDRAALWLVPAQFAMGVAILAWGGEERFLYLAVALLVVVAIESRTHGLGRYLLAPALGWNILVTSYGLLTFLDGRPGLALAGLVFVAVGLRVSAAQAMAVGLTVFSMGMHGYLFFGLDLSRPSLVVTTFLLFAASTTLSRRVAPTLRIAFVYSIVGHGVLGLAWLAMAWRGGNVGMEPLIVVLLGWPILTWARRENNDKLATVAVALFASYPSLQLYATGAVSSVPVLLLVALAALLGLRLLPEDRLRAGAIALSSMWRVLAAACLLFTTGASSLALALALVATTRLVARSPSRSALLVVAHLSVWITGVTTSLLPVALVEVAQVNLALMAVLALGWLVLVERFDASESRWWLVGVECGLLVGFVAFGPGDTALGFGSAAALVAIAMVFAGRHIRNSLRASSTTSAWAMVVWLGVAALVAYGAAWWSFGSGRASYVLLALAALQYGVASFWERLPHGAALARVSRTCGFALALAGGGVAILRMQSVALFAASLFHLLQAGRKSIRIPAMVLSSAHVGFGLISIAFSRGLGAEFYALAPGISLLALYFVLAKEMGPRLSRHVFTAGASFIYATPALALYDEITWGWQAALLLLTVVFGASSFWLRSRPLLTVSTAALVVDLACFVVQIRAAEPLMLWTAGVAFGVVLIGLGGVLEYRREGLAQQIRVFGRELSGWY